MYSGQSDVLARQTRSSGSKYRFLLPFLNKFIDTPLSSIRLHCESTQMVNPDSEILPRNSLKQQINASV
jgi:hypothetical protein